MPGGLSANAAYTRTVALANLDDPLSLTQQTDTQTVNGKTSTRIYTAATRTFTSTSAQNRTGTTQLDPQGRVIQSQISGFNAVNREYDSQKVGSTGFIAAAAPTCAKYCIAITQPALCKAK